MGWLEVAENGRKSWNFPVTHGGSFAIGHVNLPAGSFGCPPPPCPARVAGGRPVVPPLVQTPTARKWSNSPTWCSRFWRVFPRVLELKRVF